LRQTRGVYVAFDFNIPGWRNRLPKAIEDAGRRWIPQYLQELWEKIFAQWSNQEKIPIFFSLALNGQRPLPSDWRELQNTERLLALPKQLDPGRFQQEKLIFWRDRALEQVNQVKQDLDRWQQEQVDAAKELRRELCEFCVDRFTAQDAQTGQEVIRTPVRPELIEAFNDALARTAPLYIRPLIKIKEMDIFRIFKRWKKLKKKIDDWQEDIRGRNVQAEMGSLGCPGRESRFGLEGYPEATGQSPEGIPPG